MNSLPAIAYALGGKGLQQDTRRKPKYSGSIPVIAEAYKNDPKTRLAESALSAGTAMSPVAAHGSDSYIDGLARVAQAVMGGISQKNQRNKYAEREADYTSALTAATQGAGDQQTFTPGQPGQLPGMTAPEATQGAPAGLSAAASALGGPQRPQMAQMAPPPSARGIQSIDPDLGRGVVKTAPVGPAGAPQAGQQGRQPMNASSLYYGGIVPIEGGTDRNGNFRTSPKGAIGPGQVMPGTAPEAAKLAGVPFDDRLYRTDAAYNNKLGEAYYAKQLQDFGDPVLAAAAYNAGPGRVRRAQRSAAKSGQDWTAHLPAETRGYVENFKAKVGGGAGAAPVEGGGAMPAQMEAVTEALEMPTEMPGAPQLPEQVRSNRISVAQRLLQSGNPDLVALAQTYLDKGMDEQFTAARESQQQAYQTGRDMHTAALEDFGNARNTSRNQQVSDRTGAMNRNAEREGLQTRQAFEARQGELERSARERLADKDNAAASARLDQEYRLRAELEAKEAVRKAAGGGARNPFLDSATGQKMQDELITTITSTQKAMDTANEILRLSGEVNTGGVYGMPVIGGPLRTVRNAWDVTGKGGTLDSLTKQAVLDMMPNGSLGAQVSNSDRDFVEQAQAGAHGREAANLAVGTAYRNAAQRRQEQAKASIEAYAKQDVANFARQWAEYISSVPLIPRDKNGRPIFDRPQPTYEQWQQRKVRR